MSQSSQFQHISNVFFPRKLSHSKTPFLYNDFLNGTWGLVALGIDVVLCWSNKNTLIMFWRKVLQRGMRWNCKTLRDEVRTKEDEYIVENVCLILIFVIFTSLLLLEDFNTWPHLPFPELLHLISFTSKISEQLRQNYCLEFPLTLSKPVLHIDNTEMIHTHFHQPSCKILDPTISSQRFLLMSHNQHNSLKFFLPLSVCELAFLTTPFLTMLITLLLLQASYPLQRPPNFWRNLIDVHLTPSFYSYMLRTWTTAFTDTNLVIILTQLYRTVTGLLAPLSFQVDFWISLSWAVGYR